MKFRYIFSSTAQLERLDSNGNEIAFVLLSFKEFEKQEVKMKFLTHIVAALNANKSVRICFGLEERSLKVVGE